MMIFSIIGYLIIVCILIKLALDINKLLEKYEKDLREYSKEN